MDFELLETPHQKKVPTKAQPKNSGQKKPYLSRSASSTSKKLFRYIENNKNVSKLSPTNSPMQKERD
jgi:hypothetical protein